MTERSTDARWLNDREQLAWRAFLNMHSQLTARLNRELQDGAGLSSADYVVLVWLSEQPDGPVRMLELARGLQWEKSRLSHQLTRMTARRLIERSNCSEDRRGTFIVLTPSGRDTLETAAPIHVAGVRRYLFDALDPSQLDALHAISQGTIDRLAPSASAESTTATTTRP